MTAIVIWRNEEDINNPNLWIVSDSLVSNNGSPLIEDASKVLTLPIKVTVPDEIGYFNKVYYQHSLGFCFAGSTLMGQNSYISILPLLSNLISHKKYIPSFNEIATYVLNYFNETFLSYLTRHSSKAFFEASIFGYCHIENKLKIAHYFVENTDADGYKVKLLINENNTTSDFLYLGDQSKLMKEKIKSALNSEGEPGRSQSRAPRYVIEDAINNISPKYSSIGGDIQLGIANFSGFKPYKIQKPYEIGKPAAYTSYLGRELTPELSYVGIARVGGDEMC
ncbi:hypothetical protein H5187_22355 [Pseudoalteromonas sp. SG44-1]|uniref:hypothetical protein n=1 Tax=Pseudoalteromonas sp. SG44-1 TaxID=2760964 RepID=UPI001601C0B7|nr:hypothetical protein [Pseudoalteromonas sp. SG44-1]MBB1419977.1 hypothetical protein [Pseudoalteromonas sp. SG44-1]